MSTAADIENAVTQSLSKVDPSMLIRPRQLQAIINIVHGKDTLAILPTSYGKSMIFRLLPSVFKALKGQPNDAIVVVFVPLVSIVADQVDAANKLTSSLGLKACAISLNEYQNILSGTYNILIGTPESWLDNDCWQNVLSSDYFRKNLKCIVVDEVHKVSWGIASSSDETPFREAFSRIGSMRSFCCENVPVLALSAQPLLA